MNIIEHELGHVCLGVQVSDVVRVSLENDVYLVESMPTVFESGGPSGLLRFLLAGMAMEVAAQGKTVDSYQDLTEKSEFGVYDIEEIAGLRDGGMFCQEDIDQASRELVIQMMDVRRQYGDSLATYRNALETLETDGDAKCFKAAQLH